VGSKLEGRKENFFISFSTQRTITLISLKTIGLVLLPICLAGCSNVHYNWNGKIERLGEYHMSRNGYVVKVSDDHGILHFVLEDANQKVIFTSSDEKIYNASIYQYWGICFDDSDNFWVNSSDIGPLLWRRIGMDRYERVLFRPGDPLMDSMPSILERH
jgi:hypothetical protein